MSIVKKYKILTNVLYNLLLGVSAIERFVLGVNVNWDLKMISIKCPVHRGFVIKSLTVISFVTKKSACCREMHAIRRLH